MRTAHASFLGVLLALAAPRAQDRPPAPPAPPPDVQQALQEVVQHLQEAGIEVDLAAKTITIAAVVNRPADPIEYLLIHRRGKSHEAMFFTEVKPSLLNSAFLLLGYEPGKNASYKPIEPPPTEEEVAQGADWVEVFPPEGMTLSIGVSWTEGDPPVARSAAVEELILDLTTRKPVEGCAWIYLGGRMAAMYRDEPPVFMADFEGNLVSVCYLAPENHLATMRHERARDDQNWWMTELMPDPGTPVTITFRREVGERGEREKGEKKEKEKKGR